MSLSMNVWVEAARILSKSDYAQDFERRRTGID
jgi:hypothetical protein